MQSSTFFKFSLVSMCAVVYANPRVTGPLNCAPVKSGRFVTVDNLSQNIYCQVEHRDMKKLECGTIYCLAAVPIGGRTSDYCHLTFLLESGCKVIPNLFNMTGVQLCGIVHFHAKMPMGTDFQDIGKTPRLQTWFLTERSD